MLCWILLSTIPACAQKNNDDKITGYRMSRVTGNMEFFNAKNEKIAAYPFSNITLDEKGFGLYTVGTPTKRGIMNDRGHMVVDTVYEWLGIYEKDLIMVIDKNKYGFIDFKGKVIVPVIYDQIDEGSSPGLYKISKGRKSGIINNKGKIIVPLK